MLWGTLCSLEILQDFHKSLADRIDGTLEKQCNHGEMQSAALISANWCPVRLGLFFTHVYRASLVIHLPAAHALPEAQQACNGWRASTRYARCSE